MNHPNREEWVPYIFGEVSRDTRHRLGDHLRECAACRSEIEAWRRSLRRLDAWKLPRPRPRAEVLQPLLKWAVAALLVFGLGFGLGRGMWPGTSQVGDAMKAALKKELQQELREELAGDYQRALERARAQSSNELAALEVRLAEASAMEGRQLVEALTAALDRARQEDRRAVLALFRDLEKQNVGVFVALRKDLEGLASSTDDEIRRTRFGLVQLAEETGPNGGKIPNR